VRWIGHYGAPGTPDSTWTACTIENISSRGAGTVVHGGGPVEVGDPVVIDVERIGDTTVGLRVRGVVRHVGEANDDGVVPFGVALEFTTAQERRTAEMLFDR
jgi:hypothetical protein